MKTRRARKLFRRTSGACGVAQSLCKCLFHLHGSPLFNLNAVGFYPFVIIAGFTLNVLLKDLEHHASTAFLEFRTNKAKLTLDT